MGCERPDCLGHGQSGFSSADASRLRNLVLKGSIWYVFFLFPIRFDAIHLQNMALEGSILDAFGSSFCVHSDQVDRAYEREQYSDRQPPAKKAKLVNTEREEQASKKLASLVTKCARSSFLHPSLSAPSTCTYAKLRLALLLCIVPAEKAQRQNPRARNTAGWV